MNWRNIIKEELNEEPAAKPMFDRQSVALQSQGQGLGQYKELTDEILVLAAKARKDSGQQRTILGQIRAKIKEAGIQPQQETVV